MKLIKIPQIPHEETFNRKIVKKHKRTRKRKWRNVLF